MTVVQLFLVIFFGFIVSLGLHFIYAVWFWDELPSDFPLISPAALHKTTRMNWVGCIIYWILGLVLAPLFTIPGIFAWLFTVGRRD